MREGRAHAKLILIGEHSVVYGHPAIALPLPRLEAKVRLEPCAGPLRIESELYRGALSEAPTELRGIAACGSEAILRAGLPQAGLAFRVESAIPPGCGLGSSAAVAAATVRAAFLRAGRRPRRSELRALVDLAERHAHGSPSGLDAAAVLSTRPLWFERGEVAGDLPVGRRIHLVVALSSAIGSTRAAVHAVRMRLGRQRTRTERALCRLGEFARAAREALASGDAQELGRVMDRAQRELTALGLSSASLDRLLAAARASGALGAKLTGAGLGGCVVALGRDVRHLPELRAALKAAGARRIWTVSLGEEA